MDESVRLAPSLILIVDDNPHNLQLMGGMLGNSSEFDLCFATSGDEALDIVAETVPDLVLLDVNMPGKNGFETCAALRSNEATREVPVIFLTAQGETEYIVRGFRCGGNDYVVKPFEPQELLARVQVQLELLHSRRELRRLNAELVKINDELRLLSNTDGLLRIANRRYFDEILGKEWNRAMRGRQELSLLILDVDFFKRYNDRYGHLMGDDCLKKVASVLSSSLRRTSDLAARYGGEEFAAIMPDTTLEGAELVAATIHDALRIEGISHESSEIGDYLTVSIGVASVVPVVGMMYDALIAAADKALYTAKTSGRNRTCSAHVSSESGGGG